MKKLNVGCGLDIREGWTNLDSHDSNGADVVFDLNDLYKEKKLPFKENTFDYILCSRVLHTFQNPVPILNEMVRICKVGGKIEIITRLPTYIYSINYVRGYTLGQMINYARGNDKDYAPKYRKKGKIVVEKKGYSTGIQKPLIKAIVYFINKLDYRLVENSLLMYIFPFLNVNIVYRKISSKND